MQFRELEFVLGFKRPSALEFYPEDLYGLDRARHRLREPSVLDAFNTFLEHRGVDLPAELRNRPAESPAEPNEHLQDALFTLFMREPELAILFELMTDFDEGLQEWRYRHVKIVERTIGNKQGTGGSPGVEFLKKSLFKPVFPDLWAIRHRM
jgi:tryptophan 2,3-dioxygenase